MRGGRLERGRWNKDHLGDKCDLNIESEGLCQQPGMETPGEAIFQGPSCARTASKEAKGGCLFHRSRLRLVLALGRKGVTLCKAGVWVGFFFSQVSHFPFLLPNKCIRVIFRHPFPAPVIYWIGSYEQVLLLGPVEV